jgi:hypothetical protein
MMLPRRTVCAAMRVSAHADVRAVRAAARGERRWRTDLSGETRFRALTGDFHDIVVQAGLARLLPTLRGEDTGGGGEPRTETPASRRSSAHGAARRQHHAGSLRRIGRASRTRRARRDRPNDPSRRHGDATKAGWGGGMLVISETALPDLWRRPGIERDPTTSRTLSSTPTPRCSPCLGGETVPVDDDGQFRLTQTGRHLICRLSDTAMSRAAPGGVSGCDLVDLPRSGALKR